MEASGILKAMAANLFKISSDLRLLASGPDAGLGEIRLPACQAGSTIMPGKVNPVIPEAVSQAALRVMANDQCVTMAGALAQLELAQFLPLLAHALLESLRLLVGAARILRERCILGVEARPERCRAGLTASKAAAAALVPVLGYAAVERAVQEADRTGVTVHEALVRLGLLDRERIDALLSPQRLRQLGFDPAETAALLGDAANPSAKPPGDLP